jgi:hypothetical protein
MPENFALSPNDRKAQESYAVGTRDLVFLQIEVNCTTDNLETDYTASDSNFQRLLQVLQQRIEIYGVGEPDGNKVTVIAARSTIPYAAGEEADAGGNVTALEDMIDASSYFASSSVFQGQINGWSIENDC